MNERLQELTTLWGKSLDNGLAGAEEARLRVLLEDPQLCEEFADWQASRAANEPEQGMDATAWKNVDAKVLRGFRRHHAPLWAKPALWLALAGALALAGVGAWLVGTESDPDRSHLSVEGGAFTEEREVEREKSVEASEAPEDKRLREVRSGEFPVVLTQSRPGRARVLVVDTTGKVVRVIFQGELAKGRFHFSWNGTDSEGKAVQPGRYRVTTEGPDGNRSRDLEIRPKR